MALGGETVVEYALSAKRVLGPDTFVMGYANGVVGNIPSERFLREGGCEGRVAQAVYGLPAPWSGGIEGRFWAALRTQPGKPGWR